MRTQQMSKQKARAAAVSATARAAFGSGNVNEFIQESAA